MTPDPSKALAPQGRTSADANRRWSGRHSPRRHRREEILRGVGDVLRASGLSSLTMQSIAAELGITKANLYYYFRDKQDILFHCHMRSMELSLEALDEAQIGTGKAEPRLHKLLVRHILGILDQGLGNIMLTDLESLSPAQRSKYVAKRDRFEAGVRALIDTGIANGEFHCDDIRLAGFAILGAINWSSKWYRPDGQLSSADVAARMAEFLLRALKPNPADRIDAAGTKKKRQPGRLASQGKRT